MKDLFCLRIIYIGTVFAQLAVSKTLAEGPRDLIVDVWLLIIGFIVLVVLAVLPLLVLPLLLTGKQRRGIAVQPFESGQVPVGEARRRFVMQYYPYLLIFVVFDVMAMFLFAWAVSYNALGLEGSLTVLIFLAVVLAPMLYGLKMAERRELW